MDRCYRRIERKKEERKIYGEIGRGNGDHCHQIVLRNHQGGTSELFSCIINISNLEPAAVCMCE